MVSQISPRMKHRPHSIAIRPLDFKRYLLRHGFQEKPKRGKGDHAVLVDPVGRSIGFSEGGSNKQSLPMFIARRAATILGFDGPRALERAIKNNERPTQQTIKH